MQIDLEPALETALAAEARALGLSAEEYSARILRAHSLMAKAASTLGIKASSIFTAQEAVAWVRLKSPDMPTKAWTRDWRAEIHEGHRY